MNIYKILYCHCQHQKDFPLFYLYPGLIIVFNNVNEATQTDR